ncbi:methyltransferase [Frondihabitans sp. 4ASC-45]|uniref:methyltransferase n=1 Tax=Frondihabitans sp. 4ASC-45 TaxID=3111636 RepID=UPI003C276C54
MSNDTVTTMQSTWVASGPAGAVGSIHRTGEGFAIRVGREADYHGAYPTLDVAKRAIHAALGPGADRPEFTEH